MAVRVPKTRDRAGEGRCFRSELLPPYLKKTRRLEAVIPWLYLKGVSTNDFDEALTALFGQSVKGCQRPPSVGSSRAGSTSMRIFAAETGTAMSLCICGRMAFT